jgi:hypothetical protein
MSKHSQSQSANSEIDTRIKFRLKAIYFGAFFNNNFDFFISFSYLS